MTFQTTKTMPKSTSKLNSISFRFYTYNITTIPPRLTYTESKFYIQNPFQNRIQAMPKIKTIKKYKKIKVNKHSNLTWYNFVNIDN